MREFLPCLGGWHRRAAMGAVLIGLMVCCAPSGDEPAAAGTVYHYRNRAGIRTYTNLPPAADAGGKVQSVDELAVEPVPDLQEPKAPPTPDRPLQQAVTSVHRGLALFAPQAAVDADLEQLNRLIKAAGGRLPPRLPDSRSEALQLLTEIGALIRDQAHSFANYIDARDCRQSLLYAAIGEAYDLPIFMAAVPGHLLVLYRLPDGRPIYWETTADRAVQEDFYIRRYRLPQECLQQGSFLQPLSSAAIVARFHRELGDAAKIEGQLEAAEQHYSQSIRLYGGDHVSYTHRGSVRARLRRFDEAARDYHQALAIYPHEPVTHYNLGSLLARQRRFGDALAALETAIGLDPAYQKAIVLRNRIRDGR